MLVGNELRRLIPIPNTPLSVSDYRDWIVDIEHKMSLTGVSVDRSTSLNVGFSLQHTFTPGLYSRELTMPAGSLVVSKIHKHDHQFIILKGRVSVYDGREVEEIEAPYKGKTPAGTKRILYVHTETVWMTFHPTDKSSFEEIDVNGEITCATFKEFDQCLG